VPENDLRLYDPEKVQVMVDGAAVTGFAPETFIRADRNVDQYAVEVGATGASVRTTVNDQSGIIEITILQTSPWARRFRQLEKKRATFATVCTDNNEDGDDGFTAEQSWVKKCHTFERKGRNNAPIIVRIETNRLIFT